MNATIMGEYVQVDGSIRYLVAVGGHEVTVDCELDGQLSAFVRGPDPENAAELRRAACQAVRGIETLARFCQRAQQAT